jgi:hypothetical protein
MGRAGGPATRLPGATSHAGWGAFFGGLAGALTVPLLEGTGIYVALGTAVLGAVIGHRLPRYVCSSCKWGVGPAAPTCKRCERPLVSEREYWDEPEDPTLRSPRDRD